MDNEAERFEYVLNDTGRIWVGSARSHFGRPWNFGQVNDFNGSVKTCVPNSD
jgi:hypothetical protein